ncbi:MAG: Lrp/AsnC family transcriptional regulator [Candidatus Aenigmarchaeota archaeon]|nr:Lrp/AsnC family transcriptional regulator [Candidatus Aenigmarchaeota archaeon]
MMDKKDIMILKELRGNGRLSAQQIAKKTKIPVTTVFNRVKRMEKAGVIKGYTVTVDEGKIGRNIAAYISITVDYNLLKRKGVSQQQLAAKLRQHEFVDEVDMITGTSDIIVKIRTMDMSQLNEFVTKYLRNVDGVERTQTSVILESF